MGLTMLLKNLFLRDDGDLKVSDTDVKATTADESSDESLEDNKNVTEDENKDTSDDSDEISEDSEGQKEESEDSDDYLEDEEEYVRQYNLPDEIKTTHDALEYLADHRGDNPDSAKVKQINEHLKSLGYPNGVDDLLRQNAQSAQQGGGYVTASETINRKIVSGELSPEEARLLKPLAEHNDNVVAILGEGLRILFDELNGIKRGSETIASRQSEVDYRNFVREIKKEKVRPLTKTELDRVMKEIPGLTTYHEAQMFSLLRNPAKMQHHLGMMRSNFEKSMRKRLRTENKRFLKAKKHTDEKSGKSYDDYYMPGGEGDMSADFWKLPDEEQERILNRKLKR
jgi:hypothetical protein